MTLDEAIKHAEEVSESNFDKAVRYEDAKCGECAKEHYQLAEWLKELKQIRDGKQTVDHLHIKICPFCGNDGTIRILKGKGGWRDRYAVICNYDDGGCGAESGLYHSEAEAIEAWNSRIK